MLRYGRAIDPFGNLVDEQGRSLAPDGRVIDPVSYVSRRGEPCLDPARDAAYTRALGVTLVEHYRRETVIMTTQLVAHVLFRKLVQETPGVDLFGRVRRRGEISWSFEDYVRSYSQTRDRLRELASAGEVHLSNYVEINSAERAFERATDIWDGYHSRTVAHVDDGQIVLDDPALLLYYQNRLLPFAEAIAGAQDQRAAQEIAALGGER